MSATIARRTSLLLVAISVIAVGAYLATNLLQPDGQQTTNNAYVRADFTLVAPKISGHIIELLVEDNQSVQQDQLLARLDPRDYLAAEAAALADVAAAQAHLASVAADLAQQQSKIAAAQAQVEADRADHTFARQELSRYENLSRQGAGSVQLAQQAQSRTSTSKAQWERANASLAAAQKQVAVLQANHQEAHSLLQLKEALLEQARLKRSYTEIRAPIAGVVGKRSIRTGAYVQPGNSLLAIVPLQAAYVVANFQETQLTQVQPGQVVSLKVDSFPSITLRGRVDSLAPASGLSFAPIAPDNATGNFTKIVQRIPVKIRFEANQPLVDHVRVGMSVTATIHTQAEPMTSKLAGVTP